MTRAEFEADLRREGFALGEGAIEPNEQRPAHVHDFDARLFVLDGALTLVIDGDRRTYGPGDTCQFAAGTRHEEHAGPTGVRYLAGRRAAAHAAAHAATS